MFFKTAIDKAQVVEWFRQSGVKSSQELAQFIADNHKVFGYGFFKKTLYDAMNDVKTIFNKNSDQDTLSGMIMQAMYETSRRNKMNMVTQDLAKAYGININPKNVDNIDVTNQYYIGENSYADILQKEKGNEDIRFDTSFTKEMANNAVEKGKIMVYSPYRIKEGVFVTPSALMAEKYANGKNIYNSYVNLEDVQWQSSVEGHIAFQNSVDSESDLHFDSNGDILYIDGIDIPYRERVQLQDYILRKNHSEGTIKKTDCKEIGDNFYIWNNKDKTNFDILIGIPIVGNEEKIRLWRKKFNDKNDGIGIDSYRLLQENRNGRRRSDSNITIATETGFDGNDGRLRSGQLPTNNERRYFDESGRDSENPIVTIETNVQNMIPDTKADGERVAENAERARDYAEAEAQAKSLVERYFSEPESLSSQEIADAEALIEEATGITAEADPHFERGFNEYTADTTTGEKPKKRLQKSLNRSMDYRGYFEKKAAEVDLDYLGSEKFVRSAVNAISKYRGNVDTFDAHKKLQPVSDCYQILYWAEKELRQLEPQAAAVFSKDDMHVIEGYAEGHHDTLNIETGDPELLAAYAEARRTVYIICVDILIE